MLNPDEIAMIAAKKRAVIGKLQGVKSEADARADELYHVKRDQEHANKLSTEEREIAQEHPLDLFVTPPELAARMVKLAEIQPGDAVLEPSAGTGNIAKAIKENGIDLLCIELNYRAAKLLQERGYNILCTDFLEHEGKYDQIIMNPPFSDDIAHVKHAFDLLNDGGRIVAIMGEGPFFRGDKKSVLFREWLDDTGTSEILPSGTFKTSGTMVNARLVIIDKV